MSGADNVTKMLSSAPLPTIVEKLGIAIAEGQKALDTNSAQMAKTMADTQVQIGEETYNLLSLGFTPSFYAFTEATVEAKLSFSITEQTEVGVSASATVGATYGVVMAAATVSASYARKYSLEASGSSSLAARLVSIPPPDRFMEVLNDLNPENN